MGIDGAEVVVYCRYMKRNRMLQVRVSEEELAKMEAEAAGLGMTVSAWARLKLLNGAPVLEKVAG